jgi:hypothetical protein
MDDLRKISCGWIGTRRTNVWKYHIILVFFFFIVQSYLWLYGEFLSHICVYNVQMTVCIGGYALFILFSFYYHLIVRSFLLWFFLYCLALSSNENAIQTIDMHKIWKHNYYFQLLPILKPHYLWPLYNMTLYFY